MRIEGEDRAGLERLVAFVPPPRMHRHRYHGVLAPHAGLRAAVVAIGRSPAEMPSPADGVTLHPVPGDLDELPRSASPARIRWAVLLARIYEVLPLLCPACGGSMKILAFIIDPPVVSAILVHLDLPNKPPPLAPPRGPPQRDFMFDQTSSFDPADPEPVPDFQFSARRLRRVTAAPPLGHAHSAFAAHRPSPHGLGPYQHLSVLAPSRPVTLVPAGERLHRLPLLGLQPTVSFGPTGPFDHLPFVSTRCCGA